MVSRTFHACVLVVLTLLVSCSQQEPPVSQNEVSSAVITGTTSPEAPETPQVIPFAIFPAQMRELASEEVIARGQSIYEGLCRACHGTDLRGGDQGGPNLLRSQVVLNDEHGELIGEVIQNGRNNPGMPEMPPLQVPADDRIAVAEYIHSVWSNQAGQGGPPQGIEAELDIVVGDPAAGEAFFNLECTGCHSLDSDLNGISEKIPSAEDLQNSWVAGRRWGAPNPDADPSRREVRVTVMLGNGVSVNGVLVRHDDFLVSLVTDDGVYRSFTLHENTEPGVTGVEINDPLQRHRELLSELTNKIMHDVTAFLVTQ